MMIVGIGSTADSLVVDGFTIQGAYARHSNFNDPSHDYDYGGTMVPGHCGGGIYTKAPPGYFEGVLRHLTVNGNRTYHNTGSGGGVNVNGPLNITDCIVSGNSAHHYGGGIALSGSPHITNCIFSGNAATGFSGGGMHNINASPVITNCTFWGK